MVLLNVFAIFDISLLFHAVTSSVTDTGRYYKMTKDETKEANKKTDHIGKK